MCTAANLNCFYATIPSHHLQSDVFRREIIQYDDPRISLVHSDVEKLENKPAPVFNKGRTPIFVCVNW